MRHRYTMKQLEEWDDLFIINMILSERYSDVTNMYTPFAKKIKELKHKIDIGNIFSCPEGKVFNSKTGRCVKRGK